MERYFQLKEMLLAMETDFRKFYDKKNKAAGTRVRKNLQDLKNLAQDIRMEIQEIKNNEGK